MLILQFLYGAVAKLVQAAVLKTARRLIAYMWVQIPPASKFFCFFLLQYGNQMSMKLSPDALSRLPKMTEEQIKSLEARMNFMKNAALNDVLSFDMKNEFFNGWKDGLEPKYSFEITKLQSSIELVYRGYYKVHVSRMVFQCD